MRIASLRLKKNIAGVVSLKQKKNNPFLVLQFYLRPDLQEVIKMRIGEIKKMAKSLGLKASLQTKKPQLIKAIQRKEGNFDCFGTAIHYCDQEKCLWREDCLTLSKSVQKLKMKWVKRILEKWKRFIEETAKENEKMWKGESPSCCNRDKNKELPKDK